jgi:integrase
MTNNNASDDLALLADIARRLEARGIDPSGVLAKPAKAKTRTSGEGSIVAPNPDKGRHNYTGFLDLGIDGTGKRVRKKVSGKTEREVAEKLAQIRNDRAEGLNVRSRRTVASWLIEFNEEQKATSDLSAQTLDGKRHLAVHLTNQLGAYELTALTDSQVTGAFAVLAQSLSRNTMLHVRSLLVEALNLAVARRFVSVNVARTVKIPKLTKPTRDRESLTKLDVQTLMGWLRLAEATDPYRAAVAVQMASGIRPGELLGLRWGDVTLPEGAIEVKRSLIRVPRGEGERGVELTFGKVKTKKSERNVRLAPWAAGLLVEYHDVQVMAGRDATDHLVFGSPRLAGQPLEPGAYRRSLNRIAAEIGVGEFAPHELRHTHASLLRDGGYSSTDVANRLGHSDSRMVERTYETILCEANESGNDIFQMAWDFHPTTEIAR